MLVPTQEFMQTGVEAINTSQALMNHFRLLDQLSNLSLANRVLLAAQRQP